MDLEIWATKHLLEGREAATYAILISESSVEEKYQVGKFSFPINPLQPKKGLIVGRIYHYLVPNIPFPITRNNG